jgi:hypothetical protein
MSESRSSFAATLAGVTARWLIALIVSSLVAPVAAFGSTTSDPKLRITFVDKSGEAQVLEQTSTAHNSSVILRDGMTGTALGSATRICPTLELRNSLLLTHAHVVEKARSLKAEWALPSGYAVDAKVLALDTQLDLALVAVQEDFISAFNPCVELAREVNAPQVYDLDAEIDLPQIPLELEAFAAEQSRLHRVKVTSPVAFALAPGLPGRAIPAPLLMIHAHGLPGVSGGFVQARVNGTLDDYGTLISEPEPETWTPFAHGSKEVIGLIVATDPRRDLLALLPSPVILKWLASQPLKRGSLMTEESFPGGVRYLDSGAIHLRANTSLTPAGTGRLADGGTGRLADGGTGRLADGGTGRTNLRGQGLWLPQMAERTWLSVADLWSEGEPFPLASRPLLKESEALQGIYETNQGLFATSSAVPLPAWIDLAAASTKPHPSGCVKTRANIETKPEQKGSSASTRETVTVTICERMERTNPSGKSLMLFIPALWPQGFALVIDERIECRGLAVPCPLHLEASVSSHPSSELERATESDLSLMLWRMQRGPATSLARDGLRTFASKDLLIQLDRRGGYRLEIRGADQVLTTITGPRVPSRANVLRLNAIAL